MRKKIRWSGSLVFSFVVGLSLIKNSLHSGLQILFFFWFAILNKELLIGHLNSIPKLGFEISCNLVANEQVKGGEF